MRVQEGATDIFTKIFKANKISLHNVLMNELVVCQTTWIGNQAYSDSISAVTEIDVAADTTLPRSMRDNMLLVIILHIQPVILRC